MRSTKNVFLLKLFFIQFEELSVLYYQLCLMKEKILVFMEEM